MMRGYCNNQEIYKKKFVGRWYLTGDKGSLTMKGISGSLAGMMISLIPVVTWLVLSR